MTIESKPRAVLRCEMYIGLFFLVFAACLIVPTLMVFAGLPTSPSLVETFTAVGLQGLVPVSMLAFIYAVFAY